MRRKLAIAASIATWSGVVAASPVSLLGVFREACRHDPTYQIQYARYSAVREQLPESYSAIFPQLDLTAQIDREWDYVKGTGSGLYTTHNYGVSATQTLFDWSVFRTISRAAFQVRAATSQLAFDQQDLISRTAAAYYNVLENKDLLIYTRQQVGILKYQLDNTKELYNHKEATVTELEQVKGAYFNILNDLQDAKLNLYKAEQDLSTITSIQYQEFYHLKKFFPLITPQPFKLSAWEQATIAKNLKLRADQFAMQAAKRNISVQRGGYLPVLDAEGGYMRSKEPTTDTGGLTTQTTRDSNIGLNLNWNVFQGGLTIAQVSIAEANYNRSIAEMHETYLRQLANVRSAYEGVLLNRLAIIHARAAIKWNISALKHAEEGFRAGQQTITDLLSIQSDLYKSQQMYARDTYAYLNDLLRLQQAAGTLSVHSLAVQNNWLVANK